MMAFQPFHLWNYFLQVTTGMASMNHSPKQEIPKPETQLKPKSTIVRIYNYFIIIGPPQNNTVPQNFRQALENRPGCLYCYTPLILGYFDFLISNSNPHPLGLYSSHSLLATSDISIFL